MSIWSIIAFVYVALDIVLGIIIYAIIRSKGWRKFDLAVNFRNLLRKRCVAFKESIAGQIGYAPYDETYHEGYDNGHNDGYDEGYEDGRQSVYDEIEAEKAEKERRRIESARQSIINTIGSIFGMLGL